MRITTVIDGQEYELSTKLRVAYLVQGQHNHKAYADVFKDIGDMTVEDQIGIIYCAFTVANPEAAFKYTRKVFQDYYLDNFNLKDLLDQLQSIIKGIMGQDTDAPVADAPADGGENVATPL